MRFLRRFGAALRRRSRLRRARRPRLRARPAARRCRSRSATPHFLVHYQSDLVDSRPRRSRRRRPATSRRSRERAYAAELADGYPGPALGRRPRRRRPDRHLRRRPLRVPAASSGRPRGRERRRRPAYIELAGEPARPALDQHTIAHELFHLIQFGIWASHSGRRLLAARGQRRVDGLPRRRYTGSRRLRPSARADLSLDLPRPARQRRCATSTRLRTTATRAGPSSSTSASSRQLVHPATSSRSGATAQTRPRRRRRSRRRSPPRARPSATSSTTASVADMTGTYTASRSSGQAARVRDVARPATLGARSWPEGRRSTTSRRATSRSSAATATSARPCYAATLIVSVTVPCGTASRPTFYWDGSRQPADRRSR